MRNKSTFHRDSCACLLLFPLVLMVLSCGGGGGGSNGSSNDSSSISYDGLTTQTLLTTNNSREIFSIIWGSGSSSNVSSAQSGASEKILSSKVPKYSMASIFDRMKDRLSSDCAGYAVRLSNMVNSVSPVNQTRNGSVSGTLVMSGSIDTDTMTGSLAMSYSNYNDGDGITYNGTLKLTIDGFDMTNGLITGGTATFTSWNIKSGSSDLMLSGSMRIQASVKNNTSSSPSNFDGRDSTSNVTFRFQNFVVTNNYDNILNPTSESETCTGRVYVDKYGYVNVGVTASLIYSSSLQQNPDSGGPIIMDGASNSKALIAPISTSNVIINVDSDGDGTYEVKHVYSWSDLNGQPVSVSPVANAGPNQTVTMTSLVTLDGRGSADLNDYPLAYSWTLTSKPNGSNALLSDSTSSRPIFTADCAGTYTLSLVVSNGTYTSSPDSVTITATIIKRPSPLPPLNQSVTYQMDYAHSGRVVFTGSISFPSSPAWSVTLNGVISYPLIVGGRVYVVTASPGGNYGASLYALNAQTGSIIWGPKEIPGTYYWSGLAYDNGAIFVINNNGLLKAFNPETGQAIWTIQLQGQYSFSSPPTAVDGIIYVGGSGSGGTLYAVDELTGNVLWTAGVANGNQSSPAVSSDGVFVSYPCQVYKFDPLTGSALWHYSGGCSGGGGRTPAYANGRLYIRDLGTSNGLIFDSAVGTIVGNFAATPIPAFSTQTGFFLSDGSLRGIDLNTQAVLWSFTGDGNLVSAPIVINDIVVVGSSSGNVYAINANTGSLRWTGNTGAAISAPDEHNVSQPLTGFAAGDGYLIVPAGNSLTAWHISGP